MLSSRRSAAAVAASLAVALLVQACGDDDNGPSGPPASYTLAVTLLGIGSGTVTSSPAGIDCSAAGGAGCSASFDEGTQVTLTATPSQGMQFTGWSGDGSGTTTRTVTMDRNRAVSASFDDPDKAVQQVGAQGGTVASRDGNVVLTIPAGALSSATEITIETIDPAELGAEWEDLRAAGQIGAAYEFGPDGLTFETPATITFTAEPVGEAGDTVRVALQPILTSEDGDPVPLEDLTVEVDVATGTATTSGKVSHFSPIVLLAMDEDEVLEVWGPPEVEVGEKFMVAFVPPDEEALVEPSLAGAAAVEQVGEPVLSPLPPFLVGLPLRCDVSGEHTYHLEARVTPAPQATIYSFDVWMRNVPVRCVQPAPPPPPPAGARFHAIDSKYATGVEGLSHLLPFYFPKKEDSNSPDVAPSGRLAARAAAPTGPLASLLGDEADCPAILVAGEGGAAAVDLCDGTVLKTYPAVGSANFDAIPLPVPEGETGSHAMLMSGVGAYVCDVFEGGDLGMCVLKSGTFPDAVPIAGDPSAGAIVVRYPGQGSQIEFLRFKPDWGIFDWVSGAVTIPALTNAGMLKSAVAGGVPAEEFAPPEQVLAVAAMNEGAGKVFHIGLSADAAVITEVGELAGSDPRRLRCDLESGVCAVSDFSGSRITILLWDGTGAPTITGATAEGTIAKGPVGIDVFGRRIVSAGFEDNRYSIIEVDEMGQIVSVKTEDLPEGCTKPGHAKFLRDAKNTIVVSCWESNGIAVVPEAF